MVIKESYNEYEEFIESPVEQKGDELVTVDKFCYYVNDNEIEWTSEGQKWIQDTFDLIDNKIAYYQEFVDNTIETLNSIKLGTLIDKMSNMRKNYLIALQKIMDHLEYLKARQSNLKLLCHKDLYRILKSKVAIDEYRDCLYDLSPIIIQINEHLGRSEDDIRIINDKLDEYIINM